jgi:phenylacetate-CoA ligase
MGLVDNLYESLPIRGQNLIISLYGWYWQKRRFGGGFKQDLLSFRSRNNWTEAQWKEYQEQKLRDLLIHAFSRVPFYKEKYSQAGLQLSDFKNFKLEDLHRLPFLEKQELREFGETKLLADNKKKGNFYSSSGSTGTPTKIYYSPSFHQTWSAAFEVRIREWAGVDRFSARGTIGGRRVVKEGDSKGPFYRYNSFEKQTYFSAYHIGPNTVRDYLGGMVRGKVEYMTGYAMSNYFLAQEIEKAGLKAPKLKAVITSSEKLSPEMRKTFKRVYQCETFDSYSGVECCGLISETPDGFLVNSPDLGILEVLDENGKAVPAGASGEVVSTGLLNFDQPLIRYRIGDRASLGKEGDGPKNMDMPVIEQIDGRIEDKVVGPDGRAMVRFHGIFIDHQGLVASQVMQEKIDLIVLRLVTDLSYSKDISEPIMIQRIESQLGSDINVTFEYLKELPRTNSGKIRAVISKINNQP